MLDLQLIFLMCFTAGGYFEQIDYGRDPPVPLKEEENRWLKSRKQEIDLAAYYIWTREGRPEGRDREHWRQAVSELGPRY